MTDTITTTADRQARPPKSGATSKADLPPAIETATDAASNAAPIKQASKQSQLAALVLRDEGATLDQMIKLTGWLPHTTRAALTGLKKNGYAISSDKVDGVRTYRAVAPEAA